MHASQRCNFDNGYTYVIYTFSQHRTFSLPKCFSLITPQFLHFSHFIIFGFFQIFGGKEICSICLFCVWLLVLNVKYVRFINMLLVSVFHSFSLLFRENIWVGRQLNDAIKDSGSFLPTSLCQNCNFSWVQVLSFHDNIKSMSRG